jgi:hypothetical protein
MTLTPAPEVRGTLVNWRERVRAEPGFFAAGLGAPAKSAVFAGCAAGCAFGALAILR